MKAIDLVAKNKRNNIQIKLRIIWDYFQLFWEMHNYINQY
jgi:hypothetical protein